MAMLALQSTAKAGHASKLILQPATWLVAGKVDGDRSQIVIYPEMGGFIRLVPKYS